MAAKDDDHDKTNKDDNAHSLDMSQAAVKRMIADARERGYITYDQLNAALPPEHASSEQIEDVITRLNRERGITVVLVEQNVAFARRASHRFALLEKGRVVAKGAIGELTDDLIQLHMAV